MWVTLPQSVSIDLTGTKTNIIIGANAVGRISHSSVVATTAVSAEVSSAQHAPRTRSSSMVTISNWSVFAILVTGEAIMMLTEDGALFPLTMTVIVKLRKN